MTALLIAGCVIVGVILLIVFYAFVMAQRIKGNEKAEKRFERELEDQGFITEKKISSWVYALYVDTAHRLWSVKENNVSAARTYPDSALLEFKVMDNGKLCVQGRAGGTLTGTLDGCAADGVEQAYCNDLQIHIGIEGRQPVPIILIKDNMTRSSNVYRDAADKAQQMTDALAGIMGIQRCTEDEEIRSAIAAAERNAEPVQEKENARERGQDIKERMEQIEKLRDSGLISESEYNEKKAELLGRL